MSDGVGSLIFGMETFRESPPSSDDALPRNVTNVLQNMPFLSAKAADTWCLTWIALLALLLLYYVVLRPQGMRERDLGVVR